MGFYILILQIALTSHFLNIFKVKRAADFSTWCSYFKFYNNAFNFIFWESSNITFVFYEDATDPKPKTKVKDCFII